MSGEGSSGSHAARRRAGTTVAHIDLGPTLRRPTGEGGATLPPVPAREAEEPMRQSEPPPSWRTIRMIAPAVLILLSSAVTATTLYATYSARLSAVESQTREVGETLAVVESASRARDESLGARMMTVERDGAVRETEQRATTRALEVLAEEIRELRVSLQRRRP